ncbi:zinc-binding dehydrogenase [Dactylosporangium aurantiacum]|uniref:Zinc-binding dehydrogenase n=1 Tax=Dactylosporangium aurantiacum TaxID=35754 RepID=A0A9Q9IJG2_9ACTN|nr:zinc-binding dehydrogenase [Dactylosporangium aurantiacum]MDG6109982.1 zinc-binding dehydrogenase [Dactylosporangium aurantiacum]UWZ57269.1 zinc-binding dehydrogenase [Dactylosporangium aurantiacum]
MRVVEVQRYGGADALRVARRPAPEPAGGLVRVRVAAAAVNPVDVATRAGYMAALAPDLTGPFVPGWDFAGVTDDGRPVAGFVPWFEQGGRVGAYASVLLADPAWFAPVPAAADLVTVSTVPLNAVTAAQALRLAGLTAGQSLLVTGASGGVGGFAVQLAVVAGLDVTAVASTGDEAYVAELGAKTVLPRTATPVAGSFDGVLNAASVPAAIAAVRDGGVFVAVTDPSAPRPERGVRVATVHVTPDRELLAELLGAGLVTRVAGTLPLEEAAEAHRRLEAGGLRGKLVLTA